MKIGIMNDPRLNLISEIEYAAEHDFDFLDLTLEPPETVPDLINKSEIRSIVSGAGLEIVGHTAYYLPFDSYYPDMRNAAAKEIIKTFDIFKFLGCKYVTIHLHTSLPFFILTDLPEEKLAGLWNRFLDIVIPVAEKSGLKIMLENCQSINGVNIIDKILRNFDNLGFHLDAGHANLGPGGNKTQKYLKMFGDRLCHVHLSDNCGSRDMHLPLGAGNIDWHHTLSTIKKVPYDGTITLEVFSKDRDYLLLSRDKLRYWWNNI
jgi:sugar phosphate isomerase/epimerase